MYTADNGLSGLSAAEYAALSAAARWNVVTPDGYKRTIDVRPLVMNGAGVVVLSIADDLGPLEDYILPVAVVIELSAVLTSAALPAELYNVGNDNAGAMPVGPSYAVVSPETLASERA